MASFAAKYLSVFLFLVLFTSLEIQARESKFFSKFSHYNVKEPKVSITEAPTPGPAPAPEAALAPAPSYFESENGFGLYGGGSNQFPPTKETPTTTTKFEDEFLTEELSGERFEKGYPKTNLYNSNGNSNNYNNNGYSSNYNNNNGYTTNYKGNGYSSNYNGNGYSNNYNGNGYSNNYNSNGYQTERQGMSDTRFMENGKYYFHVNNENNNINGYETRKETSKNEGYYGTNMYPNEFNSMEEYEKQEENQEEFVP